MSLRRLTQLKNKGLKKAINSLSSSLDKLKLLVQGYHSLRPAAMSWKAWRGYKNSKSDLLKTLSMFKDTPDQPEKGSDLKACEEDMKSLNKAVNPHKLWAKNAKLI